MRKAVVTLISLGFLAYGLIRLGGGIALLAQEAGLLAIPEIGEGLARIRLLLSDSNRSPLIGFSVAGYVGYGAFMGAVLCIGAAGALMRRRHGLHFIGAFLVLHALLFVNFQMISLKLSHLAICIALFGLLIWLWEARGERPENSSKPTPIRSAA